MHLLLFSFKTFLPETLIKSRKEFSISHCNKFTLKAVRETRVSGNIVENIEASLNCMYSRKSQPGR